MVSGAREKFISGFTAARKAASPPTRMLLGSAARNGRDFRRHCDLSDLSPPSVTLARRYGSETGSNTGSWMYDTVGPPRLARAFSIVIILFPDPFRDFCVLPDGQCGFVLKVKQDRTGQSPYCTDQHQITLGGPKVPEPDELDEPAVTEGPKISKAEVTGLSCHGAMLCRCVFQM